MSGWIELVANYSGTSVVLVNGAVVTGYTVLQDVKLGDPVVTPMFNRTVDSLGVRVTGASREAREQQFPLLVKGTTVATAQAYVDALLQVVDEIVFKGGGKLRYRSITGSYVTTFAVGGAKVDGFGDVREYENAYRTWGTLGLIVDPYGLADTYDVTDSFCALTTTTGGKFNPGGSDWTFYTGLASDLPIAGGVLTASADLATAHKFVHTGTGFTYGDMQVTAKHTPGNTLTGYNAGVMLKCVDASNRITAYVSDSGAASTLVGECVIAGAATAITGSGAALTRIVAGKPFWVRSRVEGNMLYVHYYIVPPTPLATPAATLTHQLTAAQIAVFGSACRGKGGITWTPIHATATVDDFEILACKYKSWTFPDVLPLNASWGGTVDAQAGVYFTSSGGTAPTWMLYAWWPEVIAHNMIWNEGAEVIGNAATGAGSAYGWSAAAVTGVTGAATSVQRSTTAANVRTGAGVFEVVSPATANTGATFAIYRRFRAGVTYTFSGWLRAATGTTAARIRLGMNGDIASTTPVALSTTWTFHTFTWVPTANRDAAYFCAEITAATGTTFQFDDVMVYEGVTAPVFTRGAWGPGICDAASYDSAKASLSTDGTYFTLAADVDYRMGFKIDGGGAAPMGATANVEYFIRPDLFAPDSFTKGEIEIAVFARCEVQSTCTALNCAISVAPEGGTAFGARGYSGNRATGKLLKLPSAGTVFKPYYLGTVICRVDKTNPVRWKLRLSFTNTGIGTFGLDYLILVPAHSLASSRWGALDSQVPDFISSTGETTKLVRSDLSALVFDQVTSGVDRNGGYPDDGLAPNRILLDRVAAELLVWPSDQVVDLQDSSAASMAKSFTSSVQVAVQAQVHLLRQS